MELLSTQHLPSFITLIAYIDPGSGSAIISAVIGFFVAAGLAIKTYWYKIKNFFTGNKSVEKEESTIQKQEES